MALTCLRIYNDWMIEDWAGGAPGRFIPLIVVPLWDPTAGRRRSATVRRPGRQGGVVLGEPGQARPPLAPRRGQPLGPVPRGRQRDRASHLHPLRLLLHGPDHRPTTHPCTSLRLLSPLNLTYATADWLFSKKLERFPNLKICLSEGGIGWIPYILERAEFIIEHMPWARTYGSFDYTPDEAREPRTGTEPDRALPEAHLWLLHRRRASASRTSPPSVRTTS